MFAPLLKIFLINFFALTWKIIEIFLNHVSWLIVPDIG